MDVCIIESEVITNMATFNDEGFAEMKALFEGIFPTWDLVPLRDCVKADDGNEEGYIWIGWHRNLDGLFFDPNWVAPSHEEPN